MEKAERKALAEDIQSAVQRVTRYDGISPEAEQLLMEIIIHEHDGKYWSNRFSGLSSKDDTILRGTFGELQKAGLIKVFWADSIPYHINILKDGYLYETRMEEMKPVSEFERKLDDLITRSKKLTAPDIFSDVQSQDEMNKVEVWMNDVQIFTSQYLKDHPLKSRMDSLLFHRTVGDYEKVVSCLKSIRNDQNFIDRVNNVQTVSVPAYQAKTLPEYDVFISHANADKEALIEELNESLTKLGVKIFYDKEELEWGDNWKDKILNGTQKAEFAIIVISQNFFDREWTERELNEFLNRQNRNGQKLILPILHNITVQQLKEKYPTVADIQAIDASKYTCDQIALLFARQLIKRLKSV